MGSECLMYDRQTLKNIILCSTSLIYLIAFSSLYWQIPGLYGENGLIPVAGKLDCDGDIWSCPYSYLTAIYRALNLAPSRALHLVCLIGIALSVVTACHRSYRNAVTYFLLYMLYLTAQRVGDVFLWFQWDTLLLETGFLMVILAGFSDSVLDSISLFLINWLACRLMFASGVVKLQSNCPAWWALAALDVHYESQCIPSPLAWHFHHMPGWFKRLSTSMTFYIEIYLPLAFLLPLSLLRKFVFLNQYLGGHVAWFSKGWDNFLSVIIGVLLTTHYTYWFQVKFDMDLLQFTTNIGFERHQFDQMVREATEYVLLLGALMFAVTIVYTISELFSKKKCAESNSTEEKQIEKKPEKRSSEKKSTGRKPAEKKTSDEKSELVKKLLHCAFVLIFAVLVFCLSLVPFTVIDKEIHNNVPELLKSSYRAVDPYQIVNSYGLFRVMTGLEGRPEVIVEGSSSYDGPWQEYVFYSKPGDIAQAPVYVFPHQPRLDWQMWFAALGAYRYNPFFLSLVHHLMENSTDVLRLMSKPQPFQETPRYVRAQLYLYHYSPPNEKVAWWTREWKSEYMPVFAKHDRILLDYLRGNKMLLTKKYTTGILDDCLTDLHSFVYAIDQSLFVWSILLAAASIVAFSY